MLDGCRWVNRNLHLFEQLGGHFFGLRVADQAILGRFVGQEDVLGNGQGRNQRKLLEDHANAGLAGGEGVGDLNILAGHLNLASILAIDALKNLHQG